MGLRFIVTASEGTVAGTYMDVVLEGESIVVGRGQVDLTLPDPSVSLRHLEVRALEEGWVVQDLGSRLGSRLNGKRLGANEGVPLRVGDEIEVGEFCLSFRGEREREEVDDTRMAARSLVRRLGESGRKERVLPYLEVLNGPAAGTRLELPVGERLTLGRGRDCELVADDARISRVHARVHNQDDAIWLEDAGSANGSYLDGELVRGPVLLRGGSRIRVGGMRLLLVQEKNDRLELTAALRAIQGDNLPATLGVVAALVLGGLGLLAAVVL